RRNTGTRSQYVVHYYVALARATSTPLWLCHFWRQGREGVSGAAWADAAPARISDGRDARRDQQMGARGGAAATAALGRTGPQGLGSRALRGNQQGYTVKRPQCHQHPAARHITKGARDMQTQATTAPKRAATYRRVSTVAQKTEGHGLDS